MIDWKYPVIELLLRSSGDDTSGDSTQQRYYIIFCHLGETGDQPSFLTILTRGQRSDCEEQNLSDFVRRRVDGLT